MFENVLKLLKIKIKFLYIFDTRGGGGSTTRFLGLNHWVRLKNCFIFNRAG